MPCKTHRFRFLTLATALALAPFAFLAAVPAKAQSGTLHAAPGQGLIRLKSANSFDETLVRQAASPAPFQTGEQGSGG